MFIKGHYVALTPCINVMEIGHINISLLQKLVTYSLIKWLVRYFLFTINWQNVLKKIWIIFQIRGTSKKNSWTSIRFSLKILMTYRYTLQGIIYIKKKKGRKLGGIQFFWKRHVRLILNKINILRKLLFLIISFILFLWNRYYIGRLMQWKLNIFIF